MKKFQQDFIINQSDSDKVSHHGYHRFYPWFLNHLRGQSVNFLEIGIDKTESLKLWKGYFNSVNLHGIDIDYKNKYRDIVKIDLAIQPLEGLESVESRRNFVEACKKADVIGGLPDRDSSHEYHIDLLFDYKYPVIYYIFDILEPYL